MRPRFYLAAALGLIAVCLQALPAAAVDIKAFYGTWQGNAVSESAISVYFKLTSRDIGFIAKPAGDGFEVQWNTIQRQSGDPNNPKERLKSTTVQFQPVRPGVWRATGNSDPLGDSKPYIWARIEDQSLIVTAIAVDTAGRLESQTYRRTLSGTGMTLLFSRALDGETVRTAKGRLIKVAE